MQQDEQAFRSCFFAPMRCFVFCALGLALGCGGDEHGLGDEASGGSAADAGRDGAGAGANAGTRASAGTDGSAGTSGNPGTGASGGAGGAGGTAAGAGGTAAGAGGGSLVDGIWISVAEVQMLPMSGPAWDQLEAQANADPGTPNLSDQDQMNNVWVLAKALVYARTGEESYRTEVRQNVMAAMETENAGRTLALGRELAAYVIGADLVGLDSAEDAVFRAWLMGVLQETLDGRTLISTHDDRPNNWGTHAGASRLAAAVYLTGSPDATEAEFGEQQLALAADVFKGWLGDRATYDGFRYDADLSWQADPAAPVGINPVGAMAMDFSIDGAQPEEMRRGCSFMLPPCPTGYPWGGLEGGVVQAEILARRGLDAWGWEDRALLRAVEFLIRIDADFGGWYAEGDDEWQPWLVNHAYGTTFPTALPAREGKNMGWTDWTHDPATRPRTY